MRPPTCIALPVYAKPVPGAYISGNARICCAHTSSVVLRSDTQGASFVVMPEVWLNIWPSVIARVAEGALGKYSPTVSLQCSFPCSTRRCIASADSHLLAEAIGIFVAAL